MTYRDTSLMLVTIYRQLGELFLRNAEGGSSENSLLRTMQEPKDGDDASDGSFTVSS